MRGHSLHGFPPSTGSCSTLRSRSRDRRVTHPLWALQARIALRSRHIARCLRALRPNPAIWRWSSKSPGHRACMDPCSLSDRDLPVNANVRSDVRKLLLFRARARSNRGPLRPSQTLEGVGTPDHLSKRRRGDQRRSNTLWRATATAREAPANDHAPNDTWASSLRQRRDLTQQAPQQAPRRPGLACRAGIRERSAVDPLRGVRFVDRGHPHRRHERRHRNALRCADP